MQKPEGQKLMREDETTIIACLSEREAILGSGSPLRPGFAYLLCFGKPFDRLVLRAVVIYSNRLPGPRKRYEIGLFIPDAEAGRKLSELDLVSRDPLVLLGYPKLLGAAVEDEPALGIPQAGQVSLNSRWQLPATEEPAEPRAVGGGSQGAGAEVSSRGFTDLWLEPTDGEA